MSVQKKCLCGFAFFTSVVGIIGFLIGYYARPRTDDQTSCGAKNENSPPSWNLEYERETSTLVSTEQIRLYLKYFTNHSHRAGTDASYVQAQFIEKEWKASGFDSVETKRYDVLVSYPKRPSVVSLINSNGSVAQSWLSVERSLEATVVFPYSAYSGSGTAVGELVYVNYGRESDFKYLESIDITCLGRVVILRHGKIHGIQKAENAQKSGAVGVILYSDPADYAMNGKHHTDHQAEYKWFANETVQGGKLWPAWNGDPLTPGYPAMAGLYRQPEDKVPLIKIPVQPISHTHAESLLRALNRTAAPEEWRGGLDFVYRIQMDPSDYRNVSISVSLLLGTRPVYNVVATIKGLVEPDRYVLLGSPRDARSLGAIGPSSGTSVMMEVARSLLAVRRKGWQPRRTIKLCSWGATHFGVMGSGEWVEEYKKVLGARAVAYINVENAVEGNFSVRVKGSPLLQGAVFKAAKMVKVNSLETLYDEWKRKVPDETKTNPSMESLVGEGDCLFFANIIGVPCIDLGYRRENTSSAHPVHRSVYDTSDWLEKLVDPTLAFHKALAELWLQLTFIIAGSVLIPFEVNRYAKLLDNFCRELWNNCRESLRNENITLDVLLNSTSDFIQAGNGFQDLLSKLDKNDVLQVRMANDRLLQVDRAFVDKEGLPGRTSMRHVVFAPSIFNTGNKTKFPGITDSIFIARKRRKSEDWNRVKHQISVVANAVRSAISVLIPADS